MQYLLSALGVASSLAQCALSLSGKSSLIGYTSFQMTISPRPYVWQRYSRKIHQRLSALDSCGQFDETTSRGQQLICANARSGAAQLHLFWLVDPLDGVIVDSRYKAMGPTALLAAAEGACEWVAGKRYDLASEINADAIDRYLRDGKSAPAAFPPECYSFLNLAVDAVLSACQLCAERIDLPLQPRQTPLPSPSSLPLSAAGGGIENWQSLDKEDQLRHIGRVLDEHIRPYIALDEGGIEVLDLVGGLELIISYQGACVGCHSATGATLSSIQGLLQAHIFSELVVTPKL